jgi:prevent-host-death family protein
MERIDISEARAQLAALLDAAIKGAEIIITENERPLVKIAHISAEEQAVMSDDSNGHLTVFGNNPISLTDAEVEVMAAASGFLSDHHLPDRFCAGRPRFNQNSHVWQVPILLSYPILGPLGQVGEIIISDNADQVLSFTPVEEMKATAQVIIEQHREEIEAPLP